MTSEASLENRLTAAVKAVKGRSIKLPALVYRGIPDRLILLPWGRVFFIELKREGAQTTKRVARHQSAWKEYLQKSGFISMRIEGRVQLEEFIHEHIEEAVRPDLRDL